MSAGQASIHKDFPVPPDSTKAQCSVFGCTNRSEMIVVIDMPHRFLFDVPVWGKPEERHNTAPATATIGLCTACARWMATECV